MMIYDAISASGTSRKRTPEGFLSVPAIFGSVEVLEYTWPESSLEGLNVPNHLRNPGQKIRIYRPAETLFAETTIKSFANKPLTREHEGGRVDASNYRAVNVGHATEKIVRDGDNLVGEIIVADGDAIKDLENGRRYISLGYRPTVEWVAGSHEQHGAYHGRYTAIDGNHITLTTTPRSTGARVFDSVDKRPNDIGEKENFMKRKIFGLEIEIPEAVADVYDSAAANAEKEGSKLRAELDAANGKIAASAAQIKELETRIATVTDSAYIDSVVRERSAVIDVARRIAPTLVTDSLTTDGIKRSIVEAKLGKLENPSADFINGAYATVCKSGCDSAAVVADSLNQKTTKSETLDSLHDEFVAKLVKKGDR